MWWLWLSSLLLRDEFHTQLDAGQTRVSSGVLLGILLRDGDELGVAALFVLHVHDPNQLCICIVLSVRV